MESYTNVDAYIFPPSYLKYQEHDTNIVMLITSILHRVKSNSIFIGIKCNLRSKWIIVNKIPILSNLEGTMNNHVIAVKLSSMLEYNQPSDVVLNWLKLMFCDEIPTIPPTTTLNLTVTPINTNLMHISEHLEKLWNVLWNMNGGHLPESSGYKINWNVYRDTLRIDNIKYVKLTNNSDIDIISIDFDFNGGIDIEVIDGLNKGYRFAYSSNSEYKVIGKCGRGMVVSNAYAHISSYPPWKYMDKFGKQLSSSILTTFINRLMASY